MALFTEAELRELEIVFGLKREETLPVRDGVVRKDTKVWWRGNDGPQLITAGDEWVNIKEYPDAYQLKEPKTKVEYLD